MNKLRGFKLRSMLKAPRWRWLAGGLAAGAAVASAGAAVLTRVRRPTTPPADEPAPAPSTDGTASAESGSVKKAVDAAATAVRDGTGAIAHRAVDGARHTVDRARAATHRQEQPDGESGAGGDRPSEPMPATPAASGNPGKEAGTDR